MRTPSPPRRVAVAGLFVAAALACGTPKSTPVPPAASSVAPAPVATSAGTAAASAIASAPVPPPSTIASGPATGSVDAGAAPAPEPITCKTEDDCWVDEHYAPMRRPKALRGKRPKPCHGTEHTPKCEGGVCAVTAWKC